MTKSYIFPFQRPTFLMPDFVEVFVDPNKDEVNVIGVNYANYGGCVEFFCDLLSHRDEFWIEDGYFLINYLMI